MIKKSIIAVIALIIFLVGCTSSIRVEYHSDYQTYQTFSDMVNMADHVFAGTVISRSVEMIDISMDINGDAFRNPLIEGVKPEESIFVYTVYDIRVVDIYKGALEQDMVIEIKVLGGTIGDDIYLDIVDVSFDIGDDLYLMAIDFNIVGMPFSLINPYQGYYSIEGDAYVAHEDNPVPFDNEFFDH